MQMLKASNWWGDDSNAMQLVKGWNDDDVGSNWLGDYVMTSNWQNDGATAIGATG